MGPEKNPFGRPMAVPFDRRQPAFRFAEAVGGFGPAIAGEAAVGAGTDAEIIAAELVAEIVPAFAAGRCMVGYFIGRKPGFGQHIAR